MKLRLSALRRLIRESLVPSPAPGAGDAELRKILGKYSKPGLYVTFTTSEFKHEVNDENPNDHNNHEGIWSYIIPWLISGNRLDFAHASAECYVTVFRVSQPTKLLRTRGFDRRRFDEVMNLARKAYGRDVIDSFLENEKRDSDEWFASNKAHADEDPDYAEIYNDSKNMSPFVELDSMSAKIESGNGHDRTAMRNFYLKLGFIGIEDRESEIDTTAETCVIFDPSQIQVVHQFKNPNCEK